MLYWHGFFGDVLLKPLCILVIVNILILLKICFEPKHTVSKLKQNDNNQKANLDRCH